MHTTNSPGGLESGEQVCVMFLTTRETSQLSNSTYLRTGMLSRSQGSIRWEPIISTRVRTGHFGILREGTATEKVPAR